MVLLRGARDELVRALIILGRQRSEGGKRRVLLPLTILGVVSVAFDTLVPIAARLDTLAEATPEKVEAQCRDVVAAIFGEPR